MRLRGQRTFSVLIARDAHGVLWTWPLTGPEGFLHVVDPTTERIDPGAGHEWALEQRSAQLGSASTG